MLNYMKAHFYRIIHKKSLYVYFGVIFAGFIFVVLMMLSNGPAVSASVANGAREIFSLAPIFFGGFIFSMIYNDDLSAKSLPSAIGFGLNKFKILISKLIVMVVLSIFFLLLMWAVYVMTFVIAGVKFSGDNLLTILKTLVSPLLLTLAYSAFTSIVAFGTQKSTVAISIYLAFSTRIVSQILMLLMMIPKIREIFGDLSKYVLENAADEIHKGLTGGELIYSRELNAEGVLEITETFVKSELTAEPYILFAVFFAVTLILSGLAFRKKELEF